MWWSGDGILGLITAPKDVRAWENFPSDLPMVDLSKGWISDSMPEADRVGGMGRPRVFYDDKMIGKLAAEHFLQRGFKHIAYLNIGNYWHEQGRIPAFRDSIEAAGACFHEIEYYRHFSPDYRHFSHPSGDPLHDRIPAQEWLTQTIGSLPKPLGIALTSDDWAACVLQACDDAGIAVPEEVGVLGCDNDPTVCHYTPVPLSSINVDWDRIGYDAAHLLDRMMDGEDVSSEPVLIPPQGVVARMSTNILAVPDARIARALRFIWERFPESINSNDVAQEAGLNRRTLERGFSKHLNRSVGNEIGRVRIERAKHLLAKPELKAHEIAEQCGFSGIVTFSEAFLRMTGMRPSEYRKIHCSAKTDNS